MNQFEIMKFTDARSAHTKVVFHFLEEQIVWRKIGVDMKIGFIEGKMDQFGKFISDNTLQELDLCSHFGNVLPLIWLIKGSS